MLPELEGVIKLIEDRYLLRWFLGVLGTIFAFFVGILVLIVGAFKI